MATITASLAATNIVPRKLETGVWAVHSNYAIDRTLSAGDVILMAKLPHGATVLDGKNAFSAGAGNSFPVSVGMNATANTFGSATGASSYAQFPAGVPYTVSVSDAATTRFEYLRLTIGTITSATATGNIGVTVFLTSDP